MTKMRLVTLGSVLCISVALIALAADAQAPQRSVTGTLEDAFCYVTMGAHGPDHKKCATTCAKDGIPVVLVEDGTNRQIVLLPPKNAQGLPDTVIGKMEEKVTVTGSEYSQEGVTYLTVSSVK